MIHRKIKQHTFNRDTFIFKNINQTSIKQVLLWVGGMDRDEDEEDE